MRRFTALLFATGLAAAPASVAAHPCPQSPDQNASEKFEWSAGKGRLGVLVMSLTPELRKHFGVAADRGVIIARVEPLSPAALAGVKPGDILIEVKGRTVSDASDVLAAIGEVPKGQTVSLKLMRDGKPLELSAKPTTDATSWLGPTWTMGWLHDIFKQFSTSNPSVSSST
jgi:membrane-associated protease RseP (regulator of RpoE activity)